MTLRRLVLLAALAAGITYAGSWALPLTHAASTGWKGAGVGLLALYAALCARQADGWLLAAVMALGALGDVALETAGTLAGGFAFLAGHLTAIALYLRNRRASLDAGSLLVAATLVVGVPTAAYLVSRDLNGARLTALYALGLATMAATAWLSRFPRLLTGAGALMFATSDLLIFARTGRPRLDTLPMGLAVWGLYFAGQALITLGVTRTLRPSVSPAPKTGPGA